MNNSVVAVDQYQTNTENFPSELTPEPLMCNQPANSEVLALSTGSDDFTNNIETQNMIVATPAIIHLDSSIRDLSLCSVGEIEQNVKELPVLTSLPVHRTQTKSDIFENARQFSSLSSPLIIQQICCRSVPNWGSLYEKDLNVDQLMFGLSNQLFKVEIEDTQKAEKYKIKKVLFRIYGKDVNSLYDSKICLKVFKKLASLGVAPKLIAEFEGGQIEEWIEGAPLQTDDMCKPTVLIGVAAIVAGIHLLDLSKTIDTTPCIVKCLIRWRDGAMNIYNSVGPDHPSYLTFKRLELPKLYEESFRLHQYLFPEGVVENEVTRVTFCHNDIQENNIMLTNSCMRLIDFEYSGYNYPAYDIACYFWETCCDYCVQTYPFFRIDPTKYPTLEQRRLFCAFYLTKLTKQIVKTSYTERLNSILDAVERFQLAAHMLWAFWSVIRAPQAATATDFDMLYYGQKRIDGYWTHKAKLLAQGKI